MLISALRVPFFSVFPEIYTGARGPGHIADAFWIAEIVLNFMIVPEHLNTIDPKKIAWHYFKTRFWPDLIVTLVPAIGIHSVKLQLVRLLRLLWLGAYMK